MFALDSGWTPHSGSFDGATLGRGIMVARKLEGKFCSASVVHLAIDNDGVPLRREGTARRGAARRPGVALEQTRRTKDGAVCRSCRCDWVAAQERLQNS